MHGCKIIAVIPLIMLLFACASTEGMKKGDLLYNHVVKMDRDGTPLDIENPAVKLEDSEFEERVASMVEKIKESGDKTVMIYVHGAPIFGDVEIPELLRQYHSFEAANMPWYPIFFTWKGSLGDVYEDHLFRIRWGSESPVLGKISSPLYLAADFLRSLSAAPKTWLVQMNHIWRTEFPQLDLSGAKQAAKHKQILLKHLQENMPMDGNDAKAVDITETATHDPKMSLATMAYFQRDAFRYLPQAVLAPPISSFGKSVWKNYQRRVDAAIWRTSDFGTTSRNSLLKYEPTGTLAMLINKLNKDLNKDTKENYRFVLIGHSTGTNILSKLISQFPDLNYRHIVFIGSAATLEDFRAVIIPYLEDNEKTKFFNISLDGYAEARSTNLGITPYGSLLEWLDNFIAEPSSPMHRVMGKWDNMISAQHIIPNDVRGRVILKQLSYGKDGVPQKHGDLDDIHMDFNLFDCKYWQTNIGNEAKHNCRAEYTDE